MFARFLIKSTRNTFSSHWIIPSKPILLNYTRNLSSTIQHHLSSPTSISKPQTIPKISYPLNPTDCNPLLPKSLPLEPLKVSESVKELLPLLVIQPSHYIIIHIHGRPYLVTTGDKLRLPFRMSGVVPGDVLRLNRATCIGSRDYTLKGTPYVDERFYECRAIVMGTESEPMRFKEKTKRRCRKVKTVKSKHRFTVLRIAEFKIKNLTDIET
ncbi:54S ribosomal protein L49, mitochondrial [Erysiphe neolycopersici]|uniref:Large ribosomal subunit protein bL21m n=1 Tax=Erysiphe neolycopersici TaxID=212602 RepID=A0A420HP39_9PEZI|nr:54S ribosomal protein L49, mitochondrial [Erysiphe neolycopersici]